MDVSFSSWLLIFLGLAFANLPFLNERLFGVLPKAFSVKPFRVRLLEMVALYVVLGGVAYLLEGHIGNVFSQRWEFYAVTVCLFIVFAFPGFVFRYLRKSH
ncbi:MAG TPA: DUF2818 family protein [Armatimonadota bacterium]|nr:DUF2818 family protein [Armatimonadota bacterium]